MTKRSPFRYFKTSSEIIRLAVMMYDRFPLPLHNVEDLLHWWSIEGANEQAWYFYRNWPSGKREYLDINELDGGEGSAPVSFPPPLSPLRTNDTALTGKDFSVLSKGFA